MSVIFATPKRKLCAAFVASVCLYLAFPYVRCWSLASTANAASQGELGCGRATIQLHTATGVISLPTGSDAHHVFGRDIYVSRLISLLEDRAAANRRGFGPMAGDKDALCYVALDLLGSSGDSTAIDPIGRLLADPAEVVRRWCVYALYRLGDEHPELRPAILRYPVPTAGRPHWTNASKQ